MTGKRPAGDRRAHGQGTRRDQGGSAPRTAA